MFKELGFDDNSLLPTVEQERLMRQWCGQKRFVWNRALCIEQSRYGRGEKMLGLQCGLAANADAVASQNQLQKFLCSDKGVALLASGYRASVNSLGSGQSRDSASNKEPAEAVCS
jgi:hypothetical protein